MTSEDSKRKLSERMAERMNTAGDWDYANEVQAVEQERDSALAKLAARDALVERLLSASGRCRRCCRKRVLTKSLHKRGLFCIVG